MTKKKTADAPTREYPATQIEVNIYRPTRKGPILADATASLNGCFAIRGIQIREGKYGPFVSMPSRKSGEDYKDICFPCTKEFKQEFDQAVLSAYEQELTQREAEPEMEEPEPEPVGMTMQ